jgi:hypothetical protein
MLKLIILGFVGWPKIHKAQSKCFMWLTYILVKLPITNFIEDNFVFAIFYLGPTNSSHMTSIHNKSIS